MPAMTPPADAASAPVPPADAGAILLPLARGAIAARLGPTGPTGVGCPAPTGPDPIGPERPRPTGADPCRAPEVCVSNQWGYPDPEV